MRKTSLRYLIMIVLKSVSNARCSEYGLLVARDCDIVYARNIPPAGRNDVAIALGPEAGPADL